MLKDLYRLAHLAWADWVALSMAMTALLGARIRFVRLPVRQIIEDLKANSGAQAPLGAVAEARVARLSWAIGAAAARVPWRSDCLIQAIAADRLLRRQGLVPAFYLGVTKEADGNLAAHAWVRCGNIIVSSGSVEHFSVMIGPENE